MPSNDTEPRLQPTSTSERHLHWEMEQRDVVDIPGVEIPSKSMSVCISTERPMRGDEPVERKGNRCYQTFVQVEIESETWDLTSKGARHLARVLNAKADEADRIDREEFGDAFID